MEIAHLSGSTASNTDAIDLDAGRFWRSSI